MNRVAVTSSNIVSVGYDQATQVLEVEFRSGGIYRYTGVTQEQHQELMAAPSIGSHYHAHIKNKFPAEKVEQEAAA